MVWAISQLIWFGCTAAILLWDASRRERAASMALLSGDAATVESVDLQETSIKPYPLVPRVAADADGERVAHRPLAEDPVQVVDGGYGAAVERLDAVAGAQPAARGRAVGFDDHHLDGGGAGAVRPGARGAADRAVLAADAEE